MMMIDNNVELPKDKGLPTSGILTWHFIVMLFVKLTYRILIVLSYCFGCSETRVYEDADSLTGKVFQCCS